MGNKAGGTPMIEIIYKYRDQQGKIYAKLEYYNPSGSIKDRIACHIIDKASAAGLLKDGQPIVETTSGNTGIALAAYGALTRHPVHIFMPDWASVERRKLMEMFGATLHLISREEGGFCGALDRSAKLAEELGAFKLNQFANRDNAEAHYLGTGVEILRQLPDVTDFVAGVGSGGTLMGVGKRLREANGARCIAVEPDAVPLLSGGQIKGSHGIEGIGDDFIPALVSKRSIDRVIDVNDADAIAMASLFSRQLGLGVGISSGANFIGSVLTNAQAPQRKVATVFADDSKKYLSTVLSSSPAPQPGMISSEIELIDYRFL